MKPVALTLAALGALAIATSQACAEGVLSYPMAGHLAGKYGIQQAGHHRQVVRYREVRHSRHGRPAYQRYYGAYRGHGPVISHPRVWGHPPVVTAFRGHSPLVHPRVYHRRPYYYRPYRGFSYHGRGISIGIRF